ncbi:MULTISPECIES: hypothetical protein [Paenibacillus]|uniref:hypothetical protein n=1 Tax=Paenibacillus TaxID=44249 RepID=UPI00203C487A|nr:hypothetical protein [Paenibacillus camelliae]MCM3634184.1 hypothetical protein [Paenibacillus camelliae]
MKMIIRKILVSSLIATTLVSGSSLVSAGSFYSEEEKQDWRESYELSKRNNFIEKNDIIDEVHSKGIIRPYADLPGTGSLDVKTVTYAWYGAPIVQDEKTGKFDLIKDITVTILGTLTTSVRALILSIFDITLSNIDVQQSAKAETKISYNFPTKQGLVYYNNKWNLHFESTNRNTYKHYSGYYHDTNKNVRQAQKDFVPATGYSAIRVEAAPNYYNHSYIMNQAYLNYLQDKKYSDEDWMD